MDRSRRFITLLVIWSMLLTMLPTLPGGLSLRTAQAAPPAGPGPLPPQSRWVEVEDRRSANARYFRAGDYMVAEIHATPIHTKDLQGKWTPVSAGLRNNSAGGFAFDGGHFKADFSEREQGNRIRLDLGHERAVTLELDESLEDGAPQPPSGRRASFEASAAGQKVRYREKSGLLDYEYEVDGSGLKENIVLHKYTGKNEFLLPVNLEGLEVRDDGNGGYSLMEQGTQTVRAVIPPPLVQDAAGQGTPLVRQALIHTATGAALWLSVDRDWLSARERRYPVTIDPSVVIVPEGAALMAATIYPPSYGQPGSMQLFRSIDNNERRMLLKFDLSSIPEGALVHTATLDITRPVNGFGTFGVYEVNTEWYPTAVTWTSPRGQGTSWTAGGDFGAVSLGNLQAGPVNLTSLVTAWVNRTKPNNGVLLRKDQLDSQWIYPAGPSLQVIYALDVTPPTVTLSGFQSGTTVNEAFKVTVNATDVSPGGIGRIDLLVDGVVAESSTNPTITPATFTLDPRSFGPGNKTVVAVAYDFAGNRAESAPLLFNTVTAEAPSNLIATPTETGASLSWDEPDARETPTYNIYRSASRSTTPAAADRIATGVTGNSYTDSSLIGPKGETYYYGVTAVNANGVESAAALAQADYPFGPAPASVTPLPDQAYKVTWGASPRPGVTYNLYRSDRPGFTPGTSNRIATGLTALEFPDGINHMGNGSFETGAGFDMGGWCCLDSYSNSMSRDTTVAKFGSSSLKMWQAPGSDYTTYSTRTARNITGPFTVSAWSKADNVPGAPTTDYSMWVDITDNSGNTLVHPYIPFSTGTHDWERKSYTYTGTGSYIVRVSLIFRGAVSGTAWFDGVQVEPGTVPTDYREYALPGAAPVYRVTAVDGLFESQATTEALPPNHAQVQAALLPGTLSLQEPGAGLVHASWIPAADPDATYNIYRTTSSVSTPPSGSLVASGLQTTSFLDGVNRYYNTSFEAYDSSNYPSSWNVACGEGCPQVDSGGLVGAKALKLNRTNTAYAQNSVMQTVYLYQGSTTPITISASSRAENVTDGAAGEYALIGRFYDKDSIDMGTATATFSPGTHGWERKSATFTPPRPVHKMTVTLALIGKRTGKAWFDAVQVEEGAEATEWREGGLTTNVAWYYLVRGVSKTGVESQNTTWQYVGSRGGIITPTDLKVRNLGAGAIGLTWDAIPGVRYNVERASVSDAGYVGAYRTVAQGLTTGSYTTSARYLLPNGGFEQDDDNNNLPDGWIRTSSGEFGWPPFSGSRSLYLRRDYATYPQAWVYRDVAVEQTYPVPLTLSGYVATGSGGYVCVNRATAADFGARLELWDAEGNLVGSATAPGPVGCANWQKLPTLTVTPTSPAKKARVTLVMQGSATGSAYFDNLQLEGGAEATTWTDDGLADGATYSYRVVPVDYWNTLGAPTQAVTAIATAVPASVTNLSAESGANGKVNLTWTPSTTPAVTYTLYRTWGDREPTERDRLATGLTSPAWTDSGNLLTGSGFDHDRDKGGVPDGWAWVSTVRGGVIETTGAKVGPGSFKLTRPHPADPAQGLSQTVSLRQASPEPITISGWAKADNLAGGATGDYAISVRLEGLNGQEVGSAVLPVTAGTHDWEFLSRTITPTAPANRAVVQVLLKGTASGTAWFDGLQLQPGASATAWTEGPVEPGRTYSYWVGVVSLLGRERFPDTMASAVSRSWTIAGPSEGAPGLGLDDRWAYADLPVPGGSAYVNVTTGNLVVLATDSVVPGPLLAQVFRRTYNSQAEAGAGALGAHGWSLNAIQRVQQDSATGNVTLYEGDGTQLLFTRSATGTFSAPPSVWMELTPTTGAYAWKITRSDGIVYDFDAQGRLLRLSEPNGNAIRYDYDASGRLTTVQGPSTLQASLTYDASDRLQSISDAAGRNWTYGYDAAGRLTTVTDPLSETIAYGYNTAGQLTAITDAVGHTLLLSYDAGGRVDTFGWKDVSGTARLTYTQEQGLVKMAVTDPLGHTNSLITNASGNLVEAVDALGNSTRYEYDEWQRLVRLTNARGLVTEALYESTAATPRVYRVIRHAEERVVTTYENYNAFNEPGLITDPLGVKTLVEFDSRGNTTAVTVGYDTPLAATTRTTFAANGLVTAVTDPLGNTTAYVYDSHGRVTATTNALGGRTTMAYDAAGNLLRSKDPNNHETWYQYDPLGRLLKTTFPDGGMATWSYDGAGLLVAEKRAGGELITYQYDKAARLVSQTDAYGHMTRFGYDGAGRQILTFLPNGALQRQEYDAVGRVSRIYNGENLTAAGEPIAAAAFVEYSYDAAGNPVRTELPNGWTATAEYDLLNRLIKENQPPTSTTYAYDKAGRPLTVKDGNGKWTRYEYDLLGRLNRVYDALNLTVDGQLKANAQFTAYGYDAANRLTSVTDPLGWVNRTEYNAMGLVTRETDPLGQAVIHSYDLAGRRLSTLDRNGDTTSYTLDEMGRPVTIYYGDDCSGVRYTYDAAGRRLSMVDATGATYYGYDRMGRLAEERTPDAAVHYEYDAAGLRIAQQLPEGTIRYEYDRANRLKRVTDLTGAVTSFRYGQSGELKLVMLPGNIAQTNTFDPVTNRLTERKYADAIGGRTFTQAYTYDTVGNISSVRTTDRWDNTRDETQWYEYDDLYRLQYSYNSNGSYTGYTYDGHGNRTKEERGTFGRNGTTFYRSTPPTSTTAYEYSPAGWLTRSTQTVSGNNPVVTLYAYDGQGNLLQAISPSGIERYTYNARGLLTKAQVGNQFTYSEYDGDGRRVRRRVVSLDSLYLKEQTVQSAKYQYDGIFVIAERDGAGSLRSGYSRTPDGRLLSWYKPQQGAIGDQSGAFLVDHLGSVVKMTRASTGAMINQYAYDDFGKVTMSKEGVTNDLKFTGALLDTSNLYHLNARFYSPNIGRFITQDTWKGTPWMPWTQNLYVYVGNNPVNYTDPTGHCVWDICIGEGTALYLAASALIGAAASLTPGGQEALGNLGEAIEAGLESLFAAKPVDVTSVSEIQKAIETDSYTVTATIFRRFQNDCNKHGESVGITGGGDCKAEQAAKFIAQAAATATAASNPNGTGTVIQYMYRGTTQMTAYIVNELVTVKDAAGVMVGHWKLDPAGMAQLLQNGYTILKQGSYIP